MTRVNVSTLKNQLSAVLRKVKRGEEVLVVERSRPIARLTAVSQTTQADDDDSQIEDLIQRGIVSPARKKPVSREWLESHLVKLAPGVSAVEALLQDREESW